MDSFTNIGLTISSIIFSILFILGAIALYFKDKLYGGKYVIIPVLMFTIVTLCFGSGLIYILNAYILSDNLGTQYTGMKYFIAVAGTLLALGGIFVNYILRGQGIINIQGFNLFSSFLILEFSIMAVFTVVISKVWTLNTS